MPTRFRLKALYGVRITEVDEGKKKDGSAYVDQSFD